MSQVARVARIRLYIHAIRYRLRVCTQLRAAREIRIHTYRDSCKYVSLYITLWQCRVMCVESEKRGRSRGGDAMTNVQSLPVRDEYGCLACAHFTSRPTLPIGLSTHECAQRYYATQLRELCQRATRAVLATLSIPVAGEFLRSFFKLLFLSRLPPFLPQHTQGAVSYYLPTADNRDSYGFGFRI